MQGQEFDIWDPKNEIVVEAFGKDNYQVFDTGIESDICYVLFSSNGLYFPNTREVFEEEILCKDRYEWKWVVKNSGIPKIAGRIIYVRDIYKQWYARGINSKQNSVDKTLELLKRLTEGYRVITVGSSAGGYMAVLTAVMLNADYCFNFSGQYQISKDLGNPYDDLAPMLEKYEGSIFYFAPAHCEADQKDYESVKDIKCIKAFLFNEHKHASTMLAGNMSFIIDRSEEECLLLQRKNRDKEINKFVFLLQTVPFLKTVKIMKREIQGFIARRLGKYWNGV